MPTQGINIAKLCARAIAKLGSLKISGYTQGNTNPSYSLRAMLNHIANHYDKSEKKSSAERLGSVPPSTFYLLTLLRDAIYWSHSNEVNSINEFFSLQKEIIKNSLEYMEFIRKYKFYNVLVLASNVIPNEYQGLPPCICCNNNCNCGGVNCICQLTKLFYSYHGSFEKKCFLNTLIEHLTPLK